jgi:hypothetical protein
MKILVTYEKKDILRLVEKDLTAQGLKVKNGTLPDYKGALEVKLLIETEDDPPSVARPTGSVDTSRPTVTMETTPKVTVDDQDMSGVLAASNRLVRNEAGKVRPLGANETLDFPKE